MNKEQKHLVQACELCVSILIENLLIASFLHWLKRVRKRLRLAACAFNNVRVWKRSNIILFKNVATFKDFENSVLKEETVETSKQKQTSF